MARDVGKARSAMADSIGWRFKSMKGLWYGAVVKRAGEVAHRDRVGLATHASAESDEPRLHHG